MTLPTALPLSTGIRHRTHTVLIGQYSFAMCSLVGVVLIWYTVNRLFQQTLLHRPLLLLPSALSQLPPRVHIRLPLGSLGQLSMAGRLAESIRAQYHAISDFLGVSLEPTFSGGSGPDRVLQYIGAY